MHGSSYKKLHKCVGSVARTRLPHVLSDVHPSLVIVHHAPASDISVLVEVLWNSMIGLKYQPHLGARLQGVAL